MGEGHALRRHVVDQGGDVAVRPLLATTGELDFDRPVGLGPTGQSLVDATYRALGYRRRRYDLWVRG